jgi:hypothetical protein
VLAAAFGQQRFSAAGALPAVALGLLSSGGGLDLRGGFDGDLVAERLELALESARAVLDGVALALPVGSELSEWDLVAHDG